MSIKQETAQPARTIFHFYQTIEYVVLSLTVLNLYILLNYSLHSEVQEIIIVLKEMI